MFKKTIKPPKKTLHDLMKDKTVITGKDVIENIKVLEIQKKQFDESVEEELRNRRVK